MLQTKSPRQKRLMLFLFVLFGLMLTKEMKAQQAISIVWDRETGCLVYDDKKERYTEQIEDGPCVRVCEGSVVTYSLTGDSTGWQNTNWSVGGGTVLSSTLTTCTVQWGAAGWASVQAAVTKADNTIQNVEICVEVIISPTAQFGVMPDVTSQYVTACLEETLYFVNTSITNSGTAFIAYHWDFDDGTTSSEFEPSHQFPGPGTYTVSLTVTNACNCTSSYKIIVEIKHGGFDIICPSVVCDGERASYSLPPDVVIGCAGAGYNWSVSGGTIVSAMPYGPQIQVDWDNVDSTGFGYVTFDATGCDLECAGITTIQVPVIQSHGTIDGVQVVCSDEQNIYSLPQWPSTVFNWTLDDNGTGAVLVHNTNANEIVLQTFSGSGTVVLHATYTNTFLNCGGIADLVIDIKPRADISGPTSLCAGTAGSYTLAAGYSGDWVLTGPGGTVTGSGPSFGYTFATAGTYQLSVSGSTFCRPNQVVIVVKDKELIPDVITGPDVMCPYVPETYTVNNTIPGTQIGWEVINGTIAGSNYGNSISVTFNASGPPYLVKAWRESLSNPNCVSDTLVKTITLPVVDLDITGSNVVCASTYANYSVSYADGENYNWTISPPQAGSVSSGNGTQTVNVLWNQYSGTASLVLDVTKCGLSHIQTFPVDVITTPNITLVSAPTQVCRGSSATFTLASTPALTSGTITWDFGDGSGTTTTAPGGLSVTHPYTVVSPGSLNYNVVITVTGPNGCVNNATINHSIVVLPAPVASITPAGVHSICPESSLNEPVTVNIQGGLTGINSITWYNSAGIITTPPLTTTIYVTSYESYYAIVENSSNCTTTTNIVTYNGNCNVTPCTITPPPVVDITSAVNNCGTISVTASASGSPVINWFTLPVASSQTTTSTTGQFTFTESGNYTVYYQATYGTCTVTKTVNVLVPYMPELRYTITCGSTPGTYDVTLLDNSNYFPGAAITNWQFFVDGSPVGTGLTTSYLANLLPGTHTIGLTIDNATYPSCSVTPITLVLPNMPNAAFTHDAPKCEDAAVSFTPSFPALGYTYSWQLESGVYNLQQNATRVYDAPGVKTVYLTITNQYGCSATTSQSFTITPNNLAGFLTATPATACEGSTSLLQYNNTGTTLPQTYYWMKGNTLLATNTSPSYSVSQPGSYWVKIESSLGCLKTNITPIVVTFVKPPVAHISGQDAACVGNSFTLSTPEGPDDAEIFWIIDGTPTPAFNDQTSITQTFYTPGTHTYVVIVQIPNGAGGYCSASDTHTVEVYPTPGAPSISLALIDCASYTFELTATASGTGTFTWSNGMNGPVIQVTQGGSYQVRFTSPSGCFSTAQIDIPTDPAVYLWTVPDGCYSFCKEVLASISITGPIIPFPHWEWLYNGGPVVSGSNSVVTPLDPGAYGPGTFQLVLDNGYCPRVSEEVDIATTGSCDCKLVVKLKSIKAIYKEFCYYEIYYEFNNPYPYPLTVTLTMPNGEGIYVPASITVPPGISAQVVHMIPLGGFTGGTATTFFETMLEGNKPCLTRLPVKFPTCGEGQRLAQEINESSLIISPNPANDVVQLNYTYANSKDQDVRSLEIYSLLGVLLESNNPKEASGTWQPDLGRYPAGQYIVVMRLNGSLLFQKSLILQ